MNETVSTHEPGVALHREAPERAVHRRKKRSVAEADVADARPLGIPAAGGARQNVRPVKSASVRTSSFARSAEVCSAKILTRGSVPEKRTIAQASSK